MQVLAALLIVALLAGCAGGAGLPRMQDMSIIAKNEGFALVRLKRGQDYAGVAHAFYGDTAESWQIRELNREGPARAGDIVAVPLQAANATSVYANGYRTVPILCYHQFTSNEEASHQLELSAAAFEAQLKYMRDNDFVLLSFADIKSILDQGRAIPEKSAVITIDDGYRSVYEVAWPLLQKYNAPATLFVYTDFIGAPAAMSWQQLRELAGSGLIEIESHGKSHSSLARRKGEEDAAYAQRLQQEISGANGVFASKLGSKPTFLSYPYGDSSDEAAIAARQHGIELAATVTRGDVTSYASPYLLHRTMIYDSHSLADFRKLLRVFRNKDLQ